MRLALFDRLKASGPGEGRRVDDCSIGAREYCRSRGRGRCEVSRDERGRELPANCRGDWAEVTARQACSGPGCASCQCFHAVGLRLCSDDRGMYE